MTKEIELISTGNYHESLKIEVHKKNVEISAFIDGCGQNWKIEKSKLLELLQ